MVNKIPKKATLLGDIETNNAKISLYENWENFGSAKLPYWYVKIEYSEDWLAHLDNTSLQVPLCEKVEVRGPIPRQKFEKPLPGSNKCRIISIRNTGNRLSIENISIFN